MSLLTIEIVTVALRSACLRTIIIRRTPNRGTNVDVVPGTEGSGPAICAATDPAGATESVVLVARAAADASGVRRGRRGDAAAAKDADRTNSPRGFGVGVRPHAR